MNKALSKFAFLLEQDEHHWPPVAVEHLWVDECDNKNSYLVRTSPFFVPLAFGDEVEVVLDTNGEVDTFKLVQPSNYSLIRILARCPKRMKLFQQAFEKEGWMCECFDPYKLLSLSLPPTASLEDFDRICQLVDPKGEAPVSYPRLSHKE